jgi:predicted O-methyltransferase YrrM
VHARSSRDWRRDGAIIRLARRMMFTTGARHWGTKSFECWTFLMALLSLVRPRAVVELGSGRSTSYLTEYAMKTGVPFASIEQNRFYVAEIRRGLRNSFLSERYVHHVPLAADGWYDAARLDRTVDFTCDFLFVDGPVGADEALGRGRRNLERAVAWLSAAAATSRVVMVDDVHRRTNLELFHALSTAAPDRAPLYLSYHVQPAPNVLGVAVPSSAFEALTGVCATLAVGFATDYSAAQCSEP